MAIYIALEINKYPSRSTITRIIKERIGKYKIAQAQPIDEERYNVTYESISDFYKELKKEAEGVPVGFIFNLDESGPSQ